MLPSFLGNRLALGVRICGDEFIEGGTTIEEAVEVARMVEATGQVDYINAHAAGTPVATLIAEGAAAMEQRELALTAGLATDQPRVLG